MVIGGYAFACLAAGGVAYLNQRFTKDAASQASAGMAAFGDFILFIMIFGFLALFGGEGLFLAKLTGEGLFTKTALLAPCHRIKRGMAFSQSGGEQKGVAGIGEDIFKAIISGN